MKAILIARVSTEESSRRLPAMADRQREAGNSLPAQVAHLERYCQNKGFETIQVCSFDESAYTNDRTGNQYSYPFFTLSFSSTSYAFLK